MLHDMKIIPYIDGRTHRNGDTFRSVTQKSSKPTEMWFTLDASRFKQCPVTHLLWDHHLCCAYTDNGNANNHNSWWIIRLMKSACKREWRGLNLTVIKSTGNDHISGAIPCIYNRLLSRINFPFRFMWVISSYSDPKALSKAKSVFISLSLQVSVPLVMLINEKCAFLTNSLMSQEGIGAEESLVGASRRHTGGGGDAPVAAEHDLHEICGFKSLLLYSWKGTCAFLFCLLHAIRIRR